MTRIYDPLPGFSVTLVTVCLSSLVTFRVQQCIY